MPYTLKNLSGFPLDVSTAAGPDILPAHGELKSVDLGALDAEIMRQSPYVEVTEVDPLDHDADGRKGGSKPAVDAKPEPAAAKPAPKAKPTRRKNIRG